MYIVPLSAIRILIFHGIDHFKIPMVAVKSTSSFTTILTIRYVITPGKPFPQSLLLS